MYCGGSDKSQSHHHLTTSSALQPIQQSLRWLADNICKQRIATRHKGTTPNFSSGILPYMLADGPYIMQTFTLYMASNVHSDPILRAFELSDATLSNFILLLLKDDSFREHPCTKDLITHSTHILDAFLSSHIIQEYMGLG